MTATVPQPYAPRASGWDEMVAEDGVRPHWQVVDDLLRRRDAADLRALRREVALALDEEGVTYHPVGRNDEAERRRQRHDWRLDPLPVVHTAEDFANVAAGVVQRAELLNLVLHDLYGPRDLLRRGLLPAELVFAHHGYLRPLDHVVLPGFQQLVTCATDLARDAEGRWRVIGDRTQTPSGAGYALQNRSVVARVMTDELRRARVQRLAPYVRALRTALQAVAPPTATDPRIVVMTAGSQAETAFEHALLAAQLGYALVEGSDLRVRAGRLWLVALGRPEPVDVVLRRVDADWMDPLELRPESQLGVPGIVEATRRGTVSVVNPLGSGVLENPALGVYLPRLCEALLGQSLRLEPVTGWWCGEDAMRDHVLSRLDQLVLKTIDRTEPGRTLLGWELATRQRERLRDRILAEPHRWVGQEPLEPATSPTLDGTRVVARRTVLRTFTVADGDTFVAMPGGLTRVADDDRLIVANAYGAWSKDTWVLADRDEQERGFWLQEPVALAAPPPARDDALSARAAEHLFWLGRHAERAEDLLRLLRATEERRGEFGDAPSPAGVACVSSLLVALTRVTGTQPGFDGVDGALVRSAPERELTSLLLEAQRPGTLAHSVQAIVDAATATRDQMSRDTFTVLTVLEREVLDAPAERMPSRGSLGRVLTALLALQGLAQESLVHDDGWVMLDVGRRIERGQQLLRLLRATVVEQRRVAADALLYESVLTAAESIITYRRRYRSRAQLRTMLDLLLLDAENPRSLTWQVDRLAELVRRMPDHPGPGRVSPIERPVLEASTALRLADTTRLAAPADGHGRPELDRFLEHLDGLLRRTADAVASAHFVHLKPQRAVG